MSYILMSDLTGLRRGHGMADAAAAQSTISQMLGLYSQLQGLVGAAQATEASNGGVPDAATGAAAGSILGQIATLAGNACQDPSIISGSAIGNSLQNISVNANVSTPGGSADILSDIATLAPDMSVVQSNVSSLTNVPGAAGGGGTAASVTSTIG